MTVPFDRLGPGQVARLAYQVIGSNGPISNPAGIRYLPPEAIQGYSVPGGGLSGLDVAMGAMQVANLGLGLANLTVSAATLREVRRLTAKVDKLQSGLDHVEGMVNEILERTRRIDVNVAEGGLRAVLHHTLNRAVGPDFVDLEALSVVGADLDNFFQSLPSPISWGSNPGIVLSSDVREMVSATYRLLRGARQQVLRDYNLLLFASPDLVWSDQVFRQVLVPDAGSVLADLAVRGQMRVAEKATIEMIDENSFFSGTPKGVVHYVLGEALPPLVDVGFAATTPAANLVADIVEAGGLIDSDALAAAVGELGGDSSDAAEEVIEEARNAVVWYLKSWELSDAGLLYHLHLETRVRNDSSLLWDDVKDTVATVARSGRVPAPQTFQFVPDWVEQEAAVLERMR